MTEPVVVELRADGRGVVATFQSTRREAQGLQQQLDRNSRSTRIFSQRTESATQRMSRFRAAAVGAIAALGGRQIARAADEMTLLNARLNLVTDSQEEFNRAQAAVSEIANQNGRAVGAVGELYVSLAQALGDSGAEAEELETITQAVTQSMRVSGSSAAESAGAIRQLSQAFAAGVLRGDEFNSVNEQAPRLMQALADSLDITRGELRALALEGQLTSDILRRALVEQAGEIAEEAASIPQTMGEAMTEMKNSASQLVSAFDQASGASQGFAGLISDAAGAVSDAADVIEENALNIRLSGIAMVRGLLLAFEELRGAFLLIQQVAQDVFRAIFNTVNRISAAISDTIARLIEANASALDFLPGTDGVVQQQRDLAQGARDQAQAFRDSIEPTGNLGETFQGIRDNVNQAKDQIRQITDEMVDDAIAAANAADATDEFNDSQERAKKRSQEVIDSMKEMDDQIADLAASLAGPAQEALREFQVEAQAVGIAFRKGNIDGEQAARMLELLEQQYNATRSAIRDDELKRVNAEMAKAAERARDFATESDRLEASLQGPAAVAEFEFRQGVDEAMAALARGDTTMAGFIRRLGLLSEELRQSTSEFSFFGEIGANFSRAVLNGQGIQDSLSSAFTGFGGQGIGEFLDDSLPQFFETAFKDGVGAAMEDTDFQRSSAAGFALALGQAVEGNLGQAAFTAIGNAIAGPIGALIGSIIGDAIFGESKPKFQVRGTRSDTAIDAGTDRTVQGPLGEIEFAFRGIEDEAKSQIVRAFAEFDETIAGVIRDAGQLDAVEDALARFGVSSRSGPDNIEAQLELRFDAILSTFDGFVRQFVNVAVTLEDRVQRLSDIFAVENRLLLGRGFGLAGSLASFGGGGGPGGGGTSPIDPGFGGGDAPIGPGRQIRTFAAEELGAFNATIQGTGDAGSVTNPVLQQTLLLLDELAVGGESLVDTFDRLSSVVNSLDRVAGVTGAQFAETREDLVRFGADLVAIFGDDAQALGTQLDRALSAIFSEEQLLDQSRSAARQRITDLLTSIGVTVTEETFTQAGFKDLFESLLGSLGPEDTAALIEAGAAFADLVDAEQELADVRAAASEASRRQIEEERRRMTEISDILIGLADRPLLPLERLNQTYQQSIDRLTELEASEEAFVSARFLHQKALDRLAAQLLDQARDTADRLFGDDLSGAADGAASSVSNVAGSLRDLSGVADSLRSTIVRIQGSESTSTFGPVGRRGFLQAQFDAALDSGDFSAANQIAPQLAQAIRAVGASSADADERIRALVADLEGAARQADSQAPPTRVQVDRISDTTASIRDRAAEQAGLARDLVDQIRQLVRITGDTGLEILAGLGKPLDQLVQFLGVDLQDVQVEQVRILGQLAEDFDISINSLSEELGISLGELSDATSLLNDGLERTINGLPPEIANPLRAALAQVEESGDVSLLESLVSGLPPSFRNELAPFFDEINARPLQLEANDFLSSIDSANREASNFLGDIAETNRQIARALDGGGTGGNNKPGGDFISPQPDPGITSLGQSRISTSAAVIGPDAGEGSAVTAGLRRIEQKAISRDDAQIIIRELRAIENAIKTGTSRQVASQQQLVRAQQSKQSRVK